MTACTLDYIPERLIWDGQPLITKYKIGDILHRRCRPEELENPYKSLSPLCDISHNIGINDATQLSEEGDVLYSVREDEDFEKYAGKITYSLRVISLDATNQYFKTFSEDKNEATSISTIKLSHDPIPCMYPHCVIEITLNGVVVDRDNYKKGLKKFNKLRDQIRHELTTMIIRRTIDQDN